MKGTCTTDERKLGPRGEFVLTSLAMLWTRVCLKSLKRFSREERREEEANFLASGKIEQATFSGTRHIHIQTALHQSIFLAIRYVMRLIMISSKQDLDPHVILRTLEQLSHL